MVMLLMSWLFAAVSKGAKASLSALELRPLLRMESIWAVITRVLSVEAGAMLAPAKHQELT